MCKKNETRSILNGDTHIADDGQLEEVITEQLVSLVNEMEIW